MKLVFIQEFHPNIEDSLMSLDTNHHTLLLYNKTYIRQKNVHTKRIRRKKIFEQPIYNLSDILFELKKKPDLVVVKSFESVNSYIVAFLCKYKKIPLSFQIQRIKSKNFFTRLLLYLTITSSTSFYSVTKEGFEYLSKYFKNVSYIPACINHEQYVKRKAKKTGSLKLIYVAKFQKRKNIEELLYAIHTLKENGQNVLLSIVSMTGSYYQKEQERIELIIKKLHLETNVVLLLNKSHDAMKSLYAQHDLLIFPAYSEPLGYSLLEAMAAGLPIISSSQVGASSYVQEKKNGYIVNKISSSTISNTISNFFEKSKVNWNKINSFGEKSIFIVRKNHNPKVFLEQFEKNILHKLPNKNN